MVRARGGGGGASRRAAEDALRPGIEDALTRSVNAAIRQLTSQETSEPTLNRVLQAIATDLVEQQQAAEEARAAERELERAIAACAEAAPLPPDGQYAETWDGGETFHWSGEADKESNKIDAASARVEAERRAMAAIKALDAARLAVHARPKCRASYRAVSVGWLKKMARRLVAQHGRALTTGQVVERVVRPATAATRCRYVELLDEGDVGEADLFVSHTWQASFVDLVAAIVHVATDEMFVWLDVWAVRQWPGNGADIDFRPVVGEAAAFLLVAMHVQEVQDMSNPDAFAHRAPEVALKKCAFYRVWCARRVGGGWRRRALTLPLTRVFGRRVSGVWSSWRRR